MKESNIKAIGAIIDGGLFILVLSIVGGVEKNIINNSTMLFSALIIFVIMWVVASKTGLIVETAEVEDLDMTKKDSKLDIDDDTVINKVYEVI